MRGERQMRSRSSRWNTPFGRWVRTYSTQKLARELQRRGFSVSQLATYHWVAGRRAPRPEHARAMVMMSKHQISLNDIYRQRFGQRVVSPGHEAHTALSAR
jgi:hypothetical protein